MTSSGQNSHQARHCASVMSPAPCLCPRPVSARPSVAGSCLAGRDGCRAAAGLPETESTRPGQSVSRSTGCSPHTGSPAEKWTSDTRSSPTDPYKVSFASQRSTPTSTCSIVQEEIVVYYWYMECNIYLFICLFAIISHRRDPLKAEVR